MPDPKSSTSFVIASAKLAIVFPEGKLPRIDPNRPEITLQLGGADIQAKINAKAARKLAVHTGGAVLQGKLVWDSGGLVLIDAGFSWIEPKATDGKVALTP